MDSMLLVPYIGPVILVNTILAEMSHALVQKIPILLYIEVIVIWLGWSCLQKNSGMATHNPNPPVVAEATVLQTVDPPKTPPTTAPIAPTAAVAAPAIPAAPSKARKEGCII